MNFDGKVFLVRNFITQEECKELQAWAIESALNREGFVDGISRENGEIVFVKTRLTTRMAREKAVYPPIAWRIKNKIISFMTGLENCTIIEGHGNGGLVVSITYDGGDVYEHCDPFVGVGLVGLRCNVLVSNADSGGTIYVDDVPYDLKSGDLQCYLVSEYKHRVDVCHGNTPRVMFMYGWCVDKGMWENGMYLPSEALRIMGQYDIL